MLIYDKENMQVKKSYKICTKIAAAPGSARYYSLLFLPKKQRHALTALYAFQHEVMKIPLRCRDRQIALTKLNWWRNEINKLFESKPEHPITKALQDSIEFFSLHRQRFQNVLNAIESDLSIENYITEIELAEFFWRAGGEIEVLTTCVLGYLYTDTLAYARHLGMGLQLFNNILYLREHLKAGLFYLSEEKLRAYKISHADLTHLTLTDGLRNLIAEQLDLTEQYFIKAEKLLKANDREAQHPGLVMIQLQKTLHKIIKSENYDVLKQQISLTPIHMLWIAIKT